MGVYSIHGGHNAIVQGANWGSRKEHVMDRQVKDAVISKLRALGHTAYDDTDEVGSTQSANLVNIVRNCNSHKVDLVVSIHLNAFNGTANGVEVCYYDQEGLAAKVSKQLADDIGWYNRGAKVRKELYVLANTSAPAILLELGFIDNDSDMAKWNVDKIANSIVKALTGQTAGGGTVTPPTGGGSSEGLGTVTITGSGINLRKGPGTGYAVIRQLNAPESYIVWAEQDGWLNLGGDQWIKYDASYMNYAKNQASEIGKLAVVKVDGLWVYNAPDWNAKEKQVNTGEAFTIVDVLTVNGSKMFKCKYFYITAAPEYIEVR